MASGKVTRSGSGILGSLDTVLGIAVVVFVGLLALQLVLALAGAVLFLVRMAVIAVLIAVVVTLVLKLMGKKRT